MVAIRVGFLLAVALVASCGGKKSGGKSDAGACNKSAPAVNGAACGCDTDCTSGFCTDGVCCNSRCGETCKACNVPGSPGICEFVPAGEKPRSDATCAASDVSTCGLDGTCNGNGACRKYPAGSVCTHGTCDGATVTGIDLCDGQGRCKPGPATTCVPYSCDTKTNVCLTMCKSDTDCASGVKCVGGSCGPRPGGAACTKGEDCASSFCADGVCCNVACKAACVSCNQSGREGICWPVEANKMDPHKICHDDGQASCGQTGRCDGLGSCARYAPETICVSPTCAGDRLMTAGTCNGLGTCRAPGVQICAPYKCSSAASTCVSKCTSDNDCIAGNVCNGGSCGLKPIGQSCQQGTECGSGHCIDGVCCDSSCNGSCRSCALPSAMGHCTATAVGSVDLRGICVDRGASSCGQDGRCDGGGGCRRYPGGTICAPEHCENGVFTPESLCTASGACVAPDTLTCAPFACNGSRCYDKCTADANCAPNNFCIATSCGKKMPGALCSDKSECGSGFCAQGVCCATVCDAACKSCALSGSRGTCTNVPTNAPDPAEMCAIQPASGCGTNGLCTAGACQRYPQGTSCRNAICESGTTTLTPTATCDGAGVCVMPAASSCFPYRCDVVAACRSTCTSNADCASPAVCNGVSCGLKVIGTACGGNDECASGICTEGVCCATACNGTCMSCAVVGSRGMCTPVPAGTGDPAGRCAVQGAASCGTNGLCDGAGVCQRYAAGVECVAPVCPTSGTTATLARTCDGLGVCRAPTTQSCSPFACNGTTCIASCVTNADCAPGNVCNAGTCGKKRLGQQCADKMECESNISCVDGVCCGTPSCGACFSCAVTGKAGSCQPVPAGDMDTMGRCVAGATCGLTGRCDGAGACQYAPTSTSCGAAMCNSDGTFSPTGNCDGAGTCRQVPASCGHYVCRANACLTTCTGDGDCVAGDTCQSGSCTNLKPLGAACVAGTECLSTFCAEGFCCNAASCGSCRSCALTATRGTCTPVTAGTADAGCVVSAVSTCGTNGLCDGAGQCASYPTGTICGASQCPAGASSRTDWTCSAAHSCISSLVDCQAYTCDASMNVCRTSCTSDGECASSHTCVAGFCQ